MTEVRAALDKLQRSERLMRAIFDGALDAILLADDEGRYVDANPAACALFGLPRQELIGRRIADFAAPPTDVPATWQAFVEEGTQRGYFELLRPDGTCSTLEYGATASVLPGLHLSILRDVTGRLHAEQRYAALLESAPDAMIVVDRTGQIVLCNRQVEVVFGYQREELLGRAIEVLVPDSCRPGHAALRDGYAKAPTTRRMGARRELSARRRDGSEFPAEISLSPGAEDTVTATVRDVSERRSAEEVRSRLAVLVESAADAIIGADLTTLLITSWNRGAELLYGYTAAEAVGRPISILTPDQAAERSMVELVERLGRGEIVRIEIARRRKDGSLVDVAVTISPVRDSAGRIVGTASFTRDLTEKKRAQEALLASEAQYRALFEGSPIPYWLFDTETFRFLAVNDATVRMYGYSREEFLGMTIKDIRPPEDIHRLAEVVRRGDRVNSQIWRHRRKDGTLLDAEVSVTRFLLGGRSVGIVMAQDVTERRALEAQLRQAQKMEAIGRLAGGVAHDFNNLLSVILSYSELSIDTLRPGDPLRENLEEIKRAGTQATGLTRQLLAFSRQQVLSPRVVDLKETVVALKSMLGRLLGEDISLTVLGPDHVGRVLVDPPQVEQVVMNLAVNARDAMPDGGKLTIEASNVTIEEQHIGKPASLAPGRYVMLAVTDTGEGMTEEVKARIFEPFFTTKEKGKGTGLGLATVFGIVQQSGGFVTVYSEPGHGTTFKVYLPRTDKVADVSTGDAEPDVRGGSETILLVEDQDQVRTVASTILRKHGYNVLEAANGGEALLVASDFPSKIDLLLTDVVMPRVSGRRLAEHLAPQRPAMKVLFASGYTDDAILQHGVLESGVPFIQKPFTPQGLLRKVREVLDQGVRALTRRV